ncbi:hypothetical protein SAMN06265380_11574 [Ruegeria faecimaris]|uniref:Uncharacterized protein n=1 Tax=Ruegeria faecimaris TaxID=686389 RepID=A0A521F0W4_9RHOB|nr:hypothetical protein SAMN06265380_11574 [Ruegeria faecimaris]
MLYVKSGMRTSAVVFSDGGCRLQDKRVLLLKVSDAQESGLCKIQRTAQFGRGPMGVVAAVQPAKPAIRRERNARN